MQILRGDVSKQVTLLHDETATEPGRQRNYMERCRTISVQGVQFLLSIVIARLISPSDYGLIAMLGIFLAVAQQFIDSGFSNALVQKKDRSDVDFSTVFYSNLAIAAVVYAALYAAAPWIADFYSEPKLTPVTRWIGLTVVLMAFSIVQRAKLTIELDFKTQAKLSLVSVTASGLCGVVLAWQGYGVWALVVQTLANNFLNSLLLWTFARWRLRPVFHGPLSVRFFRSDRSCWRSAYCTFFTAMSTR